MSLRSFVGFVAEFPAEHDDIDPPGKELAAFVAARLRNAGFDVTEPTDREGWAWDFDITHDRLKIISIVGLVDDMNSDPPRQWLITNDCQLGFFSRVFGGQALAHKRDRFLRELCDALHEIISTDTRFSHIAWYNKETFDKESDVSSDSP